MVQNQPIKTSTHSLPEFLPHRGGSHMWSAQVWLWNEWNVIVIICFFADDSFYLRIICKSKTAEAWGKDGKSGKS